MIGEDIKWPRTPFSLNTVKIYGQRFGTFGPMRRNPDGKWVTFDDYIELYDRFLDHEAAVNDLSILLAEEKKLSRSLTATFGSAALIGWLLVVVLAVKVYVL